MKIALRNRQKGAILPTALILLVVFTLIGVTFLSMVGFQYKLTRESLPRANAILTAEAGIETAIAELNQDDTYTGGTQTFFDNATKGRGVYTSTVEAVEDSNARRIVSEGVIYRHGTNNVLSRYKIRVLVVGTTSDGYSVATGPGGLILSGSAAITNSDVYVNGTLTMSGSAKIGTDAYPVEVNVAHIACPTGSNPGATYPTLCTSGQPISIPDWSTVSIIGTTCATNQTQSKFPNSPYNSNLPQIRAGTGGGEGLKIGCVAPPVSPPTYDRAAHIAAVTSTYTSGSSLADCTNGNPHTRSWPANMKITGNVSVASNCEVTINGNVYITGNLTTGGSAAIRVANGLTTPPVILVDGSISVGGSSTVVTNSAGVGAKLISFKGSGSCNLAATCSGTDLKTSQGVTTVNLSGGVNTPGITFQAYWGKLVLGGSGNIGAAAGQTIDMSGSGTVTFGTQLSTGQKSWTVSSYQRYFE